MEFVSGGNTRVCCYETAARLQAGGGVWVVHRQVEVGQDAGQGLGSVELCRGPSYGVRARGIMLQLF